MLVQELVAWKESCGAERQKRIALELAIHAELTEKGASAQYEPAQLFAAFERAKELVTAEQILPEYWRILDSDHLGSTEST